MRFARYPDVACPLTLDHDALSRFLAGLDPVARDSDEDRTGIGTAVARAAEVLRSSEARSKVVVLLTDGEENVASADTPDEIGPLDAARMCEALGMRVYTIAAGIGKRGPRGEWLPLDTKQVERLAELTHGRFFTARDAGALDDIYARIDALETVPIEEPRFAWRDRFLPFLWAALALFVLGRLLEATALEVAP